MKDDDIEEVEDKLDRCIKKLTTAHKVEDRDWAWILLRRGIDFYLRSIGRGA